MNNHTLNEIDRLLTPVKLGALHKNPLVSVIVASYNCGEYISEAIDSVLHQTYLNLELIICDDGSTDNSATIIETYAQVDSRVRLVTRQNGGQAWAWNAAYRESNGQLIVFLDADDRYLPEKLETVVRSFRCHPNSGCLGHRMFFVDEDGRRRGAIPLLVDPPSGWYGPSLVSSGDVPNGLSPSSGICLRREISDLIFPLPEAFRSHADGVVVFLSLLMTSVIGISLPLAEYRHRTGSLSYVTRITQDHLDRELRINRRHWDVLRTYLENMHPRLGELFPRCDTSALALAHTYALERLQRGPGAVTAHRNLLQSHTFKTRSLVGRWFWQCSIALPRPVFCRALDIYWGHGRLKQLVCSGWLIWNRRKMKTS
jgi:glycosyltransferase involved in cell wall biosynthesis